MLLITHGILLDKELEKLKSIDLNNLMDKNSIHSLELITADNNKIYFVDSNNQLFMCDWDGKNKEIFFDPSKLSEFSGIYFLSILGNFSRFLISLCASL